MLANAFLVAYFLTSPFFGWLGDRRSRTRLMAAGVAAWSLATAAAGLARSSLVDDGTCGCRRRRGGVRDDLSSAPVRPLRRGGARPGVRDLLRGDSVGAAAGFLLGGALEQAFGWRAAFYVVGLPGVTLSLLALAVPDPRTGRTGRARGTGGEIVRRSRVFRETGICWCRARLRRLHFRGRRPRRVDADLPRASARVGVGEGRLSRGQRHRRRRPRRYLRRRYRRRPPGPAPEYLPTCGCRPSPHSRASCRPGLP